MVLGRGQSGTSTSWKVPKSVGCTGREEKGVQGSDSRLLASGAVMEYISVVLSHTVRHGLWKLIQLASEHRHC